MQSWNYELLKMKTNFF
uniref:Uncharacterized protein n=1 Tax=Arundo donax TaxID=35708 RepID=A0A0A9E090_ARUDO